ncbi:MAG: gamma-glutamylcyclotransferase family protein [Actinomycetota bacterium]
MLYFAYRSNMHWDQMRSRCPSARFVGVALLRDFRLAFTRNSIRRNSGVAGTVTERGGCVWGVVYEVDDDDLRTLDECEGYRGGGEQNRYVRRTSEVLPGGGERRRRAAVVYFANRQANPPLPSSEYKNLLVSGARYWELPPEYIRELEEVETSG